MHFLLIGGPLLSGHAVHYWVFVANLTIRSARGAAEPSRALDVGVVDVEVPSQRAGGVFGTQRLDRKTKAPTGVEPV